MFKYLVYIFLFVFLTIVVVIYNRSSNHKSKQSESYLSNNIEFEGYVTGFEKSNNHAFGVIQLSLTKSGTREFNKTIQNGIYPYRINGDMAELYCTVSVERKKGDTVKLVSNKQTVYYNPQSSAEEGSIFIITDADNIDFVKAHSLFKW